MNTIASTDCYGCLGTGTIQGFGACHGKTCLCVAHCDECGAALVWEHDDGKRPDLCAACECPATLRTGEEVR